MVKVNRRLAMVKAEKDVPGKECQMGQQTNNKDDSGKRKTSRYLSHCDKKEEITDQIQAKLKGFFNFWWQE